LAGTAGDLLSGNPHLQQLMEDLGGKGTLVDELLASMGWISALVAAAYAVSAALRIRGEEITGRADAVLAASLSRARWMAGHLLFSLGGSALLLVIAGIAAGLVRGTAIGDLGAGLRVGLETMAVQIPPVLVIGGLTAALIGWAPRLAAGGWLILGLSVLLGQLGTLLGLPQAVMDLSPFSRTPALPAAAMNWTPVLVLLLIAGAATALGFAGFRRRDIG
jgi:ABC-2 type transport system permease protein